MLIERRSSSHAPAELSEAGIGRAAVKGAIIGYFAVLMIVAGIVLAAGAGLGRAGLGRNDRRAALCRPHRRRRTERRPSGHHGG